MHNEHNQAISLHWLDLQRIIFASAPRTKAFMGLVDTYTK